MPPWMGVYDTGMLRAYNTGGLMGRVCVGGGLLCSATLHMVAGHHLHGQGVFNTQNLGVEHSVSLNGRPSVPDLGL
jgi:hypothetical protein